AVGVFETGLGKVFLGLVQRVIEEGGGVLVIEAGARIETARIWCRERALDQGFTQALAVERVGNGLAEVDIAIEFADRLAQLIRFTPAIAGEVRIERVADGTGTKLQASWSGFLGGAAKRLDEV